MFLFRHLTIGKIYGIPLKDFKCGSTKSMSRDDAKPNCNLRESMKKLILILSLIIFGSVCFAGETDYKQIYLNLQVPTFSYVHGVDPGQYYDNKDAAYSIYPLFRLSSPIYFKTITIVPGYYDLTPVEYKHNNYLLFKDAGVVRYIIPVYNKELVPEDFYDTHLPKQKYTRTQRMSLAFNRFLGKHFKSSQRKPPVKSYLEVTDLDNKFVSIVVYYGNYKYSTLFRAVAF